MPTCWRKSSSVTTLKVIPSCLTKLANESLRSHIDVVINDELIQFTVKNERMDTEEAMQKLVDISILATFDSLEVSLTVTAILNRSPI